MPARDSDESENIDRVIHEVGEVMCDKVLRCALADVCEYEVLQGNGHCLHQSPNTQQLLGYT
ncbi:MAG: hypothetical protein ACKPKO_11900, partial [Candidatus Fonsibacter sp.]